MAGHGGTIVRRAQSQLGTGNGRGRWVGASCLAMSCQHASTVVCLCWWGGSWGLLASAAEGASVLVGDSACFAGRPLLLPRESLINTFSRHRDPSSSFTHSFSRLIVEASMASIPGAYASTHVFYHGCATNTECL